MAKELDEIFYEAITASDYLMELTGRRIYSTCVEVPPTEDDNTPLPYIIITDDAYQNELGTKDSVWEGYVDHSQASVIISAHSPAEVKLLRKHVRKAIAQYVYSMTANEMPYLTAATNEGINWDWTKPCYYDTLHYQCDMDVDYEEEDNEQEDEQPAES